MSQASGIDLLLLHPPSVYDFREKSILYGPVSDMVPSSTVFEMYPIGFLTILAYLAQRGLEVRIVNLAVRMMGDRRFDVRAFLARLEPRAIGIDLHWLPHAHGALEVARLAKELHPQVPVIVGGLSATYFHRELAAYPQVDFVLRGDSTEPALHELLVALRTGASVAHVPNLTWKEGAEVRVNPLRFIPATLDYVDVRPELLIEMVRRYRDVKSVLPFNGWLRNPITMVLPVKGCSFDCATCGSSRTTCGHLTERVRPVFRSPDSLVANIVRISRLSRGPILLIGDLRQGGEAYTAAVLDGMRAAAVPNEIVFELLDLPPASFLEEVDRSVQHWSCEVSPESHDPQVRLALDGETTYTNERLEQFVREALARRCHRLDVFFMIGLPRQTYESVQETIEYCERLFRMSDRRLNCLISPMGPFVDPGSRIFEEPERFGYRLFARTLEQHRQLLVEPSWERILNYETQWMSRARLVDATYDAAERLNELKRSHGRITPRQASAVSRRIAAARRLRERLNRQGAESAGARAQLAGEIARFSISTVCDKDELAWPRHLINFRPFEVARALFGRVRTAP
ncbi:MAG TPA: TIGR04190 family B12-binding domain/radical SAM domain protein [Steroidobacteraceae bacterium]|nr:TIGR04190 family B12-binding domain/radical SAM domain protein [Steroidobacteraceae bacterium]